MIEAPLTTRPDPSSFNIILIKMCACPNEHTFINNVGDGDARRRLCGGCGLTSFTVVPKVWEG